MSDADTDWLAWSCKIAAPGHRDMSAQDDAKLRQAIARAFKRVTGQACEMLISGWGDVRLNKPVKRRRAREPGDPPPAKKPKRPAAKQIDLFAREDA
jgi:hypothetical protein